MHRWHLQGSLSWNPACHPDYFQLVRSVEPLTDAKDFFPQTSFLGNIPSFSVCLLLSAFFLSFTRTWARIHAQGFLEFLSSRLFSKALTWSPHRDGNEWWNPVKHLVIKSSGVCDKDSVLHNPEGAPSHCTFSRPSCQAFAQLTLASNTVQFPSSRSSFPLHFSFFHQHSRSPSYACSYPASSTLVTDRFPPGMTHYLPESPKPGSPSFWSKPF